MKITFIGHSAIHIRQQNFFMKVSQAGHQVQVICPSRWVDQTMNKFQSKDFSVMPCEVAWPLSVAGQEVLKNLYSFSLRDADKAIASFSPDWIVVQQEPGSKLAQDVIDWVKNTTINKPKVALFSWENLIAPDINAQRVLGSIELLIAGNDDCWSLMFPFIDKSRGAREVILPQVGVDTEHFAERPVQRYADVGYIGRQTQEKGVDKVAFVYPDLKIVPWKSYKELPWWYSQVKVNVCFSQDNKSWREQAMPYTIVEALSCGCAGVVSNGGSIPFWLAGDSGYLPHRGAWSKEPCPGVTIVSQNDMAGLKTALDQSVIAWETRGKSGREWVKEYLSSEVISKKLIEALQDAR